MLDLLIKNGIEEEQANSIVKAMNEAKIYTTKLENIDERYTKLKAQKTELETQLADRDNQLKDLSVKAKGNEELTKQIEEMKQANEQTKTEYESKISKMEFDNALDNALNGAKSKNNKALKALLDLEGIKYQEGKFEGLESQLENLKKEASYLFEDAQVGGQGGFNPSGTNGGITKDQFVKMDYTQRMELYNSNKALYDQLNN